MHRQNRKIHRKKSGAYDFSSSTEKVNRSERKKSSFFSLTCIKRGSLFSQWICDSAFFVRSVLSNKSKSISFSADDDYTTIGALRCCCDAAAFSHSRRFEFISVLVFCF